MLTVFSHRKPPGALSIVSRTRPADKHKSRQCQTKSGQINLGQTEPYQAKLGGCVPIGGWRLYLTTKGTKVHEEKPLGDASCNLSSFVMSEVCRHTMETELPSWIAKLIYKILIGKVRIGKSMIDKL
jgi:hypothetical protein